MFLKAVMRIQECVGLLFFVVLLLERPSFIETAP